MDTNLPLLHTRQKLSNFDEARLSQPKRVGFRLDNEIGFQAFPYRGCYSRDSRASQNRLRPGIYFGTSQISEIDRLG